MLSTVCIDKCVSIILLVTHIYIYIYTHNRQAGGRAGRQTDRHEAPPNCQLPTANYPLPMTSY